MVAQRKSAPSLGRREKARDHAFTEISRVQDDIREGLATPWEDLLAQLVLGDQDFVEKLKRMGIHRDAKAQPPYRMIQSIGAETHIKQAADCFRIDEREPTRKRGGIGRNGR
jgi:hypothetical protein